MIGNSLIIFNEIVIIDNFGFELILKPFVGLGFVNITEEVRM